MFAMICLQILAKERLVSKEWGNEASFYIGICGKPSSSGWWFQYLKKISTLFKGRFPFRPTFFEGVETNHQVVIHFKSHLAELAGWGGLFILPCCGLSCRLASKCRGFWRRTKACVGRIDSHGSLWSIWHYFGWLYHRCLYHMHAHIYIYGCYIIVAAVEKSSSMNHESEFTFVLLSWAFIETLQDVIFLLEMFAIRNRSVVKLRLNQARRVWFIGGDQGKTGC